MWSVCINAETAEARRRRANIFATLCELRVFASGVKFKVCTALSALSPFCRTPFPLYLFKLAVLRPLGGVGYGRCMNPFVFLFGFFIVIPLVEIYLLIVVGERIGALPTVFMVVFTAVLGGLLLRHQGLSTVFRVRTAMERGQVPALEMLEGAVLLVGGALLLTPGFFTDALGFACLVPALRRSVLRWAMKRFMVVEAWPGQGPPGQRRQPGDEGEGHRTRTIEGEFRREDDDR